MSMRGQEKVLARGLAKPGLMLDMLYFTIYSGAKSEDLDAGSINETWI